MLEALTHPSYANEHGTRDNQRLEFLGDAVLGLAVSELLSERYPHADEGHLTRMRSAIVNAEALAGWARMTGLGLAIAFGRGAKSSGEREQTNVLADAVEAVVAAVYHDHGLSAARAIAANIVDTRISENAGISSRDPKSELQERVQAMGFEAPRYRVREARGPEHDATFVVEVLVTDQVLATGEGRSKRAAERAAAAQALACDLSEMLGAAPQPL
jgi:ribonuclease-3